MSDPINKEIKDQKSKQLEVTDLNYDGQEDYTETYWKRTFDTSYKKEKSLSEQMQDELEPIEGNE